MKEEKRELTLTPKLLDYLAKLYQDYLAVAPFIIKIGIPGGIFKTEVIEEDDTQYLTVVYAEGDLVVVCEDNELEILKGTEIDYEVYGLHECIVFKDDRFNGKTYIVGDVHPAFRGI